MRELRPYERYFAEVYIANKGNAKEAYHICYPEAADSTCRVNGSKLTKDPAIQAYIAELYEQQFGEYKVLAFRTLAELEDMAFAEKGDTDYSATVKLKAIELIQKQLGLQTKNLNVEAKTEVEINIVAAKPSNEAET